MTAIIDIRGLEILDSRGNPTVEVEVILENGAFGRDTRLRLADHSHIVFSSVPGFRVA